MKVASGMLMFLLTAASTRSIAEKSERAAIPLKAEVVAVSSVADAWMMQTGNIKVTFSDRHAEIWTKDGSCAWPQVSRSGKVGWVHVDKSHIDSVNKRRIGRDVVVVQAVDGKRKTFTPDPEAPFIEGWGFFDNGSTIAFESRGQHGHAFYIKYKTDSGRKMEEIDYYLPVEQLPSWAQSLSSRRSREKL
jgi:hypothetical protein